MVAESLSWLLNAVPVNDNNAFSLSITLITGVNPDGTPVAVKCVFCCKFPVTANLAPSTAFNLFLF